MKNFRAGLCWKSITPFCGVKIFPSLNGVNFISRGSIRHYEKLRDIGNSVRNEKFYLYQRQPIDLSLEMIKNNVKTVTYITRENYETVQAIPITNTQNQSNRNQQHQLSTEEKLLQFLKYHKFVIKKSYLDLHPYEAYHSLCSFLGMKKSEEITKIYHYCSFSLKEIHQNTVIYPYLNTLRHKYLNVEGQLKLQKLDRIRTASALQIQQAVKQWQRNFMIEEIYSSTKQQEQFKRKFVLEYNLGEFAKIEDLLQGYGQKSFYAPWKKQTTL